MNTNGSKVLTEEFGPLQGVRIISSGSLIAQPFAATMAAEMGAEVIMVERPSSQGEDVWRKLEFPITGDNGNTIAAGWVQDRRNSFHVSLDIGTPRGQEIFLDLLRQTDIWMESSIPGTYPEWGLDDETVLKANPRLVIAHVSGYGQEGNEDYLTRASYDFIGQGFGGLMNLTGFPDGQPSRAAPWTGDFITALFCIWSSLAGYINVQRTGKGQVIDIAQFEAIHRILAGTMVAYYELGLNRERTGNAAGILQPYDTFQASDGWVNIAALGGPFNRLCEVLGLDHTEEKWQRATTELDSLGGIEFDAILRGWVLERTVSEVIEILNVAQVGCCAIMTPRDTDEDPHYQERNVHIEWEDVNLGRTVKGTGVVPKFSDTPGKIWRGSVPVGHDNEMVFQRLLGITSKELVKLAEDGVI